MRRAALALALAALSVHALAADGARIAKQGNGKTAACASCHGANGEGNASAGYPMLAGLNERYLAAQLEAFRTGTRVNAIMQPIAAELRNEEVAAVARYFAGLPQPKAARAAQPEANARGQQLAHAGDWARNVPPCVSCHGANGEGVGIFPRLNGQHANYLVAQIDAWRNGKRSNDPQALMRHIAKALAPADAKAVAEYFASGAPQPAVPKPAAREGKDTRKVQKPPASKAAFTPPPESEIPNDGFGDMVRRGKLVFDDTQTHAKQYVGNALNCRNCHLDSGRKADSAPMWGAYVLYPAFRSKNQKVNTMQERIQGCFRFSQNGKVPAPDSEVVTALVSYFYWMARGAPTGMELPGRGYPTLAKPEAEPSPVRGERVFQNRCAVCHGRDGQGQQANGRYVFPPLWGPKSFNGGAGMSRVELAAAFIKANMPLGQGNSLSDQDAWDAAAYMNSHTRPADPRKQAKAAASGRKAGSERQQP